ncbi:ataxin-1-like isoform X1 [Corticium candelabrum]|uniref:ataxin-1-like isoform X1 n=1 Tax=Corticium candelabrum TaxID=121492 RepID=UPI002E26825D|nr:ataxin-1-like isoform X1 [Corticium candelabrum]XP_062501075.1 ataxin-1-like isoform X1 [Corticium candelabrum]XP_062501076.1 ataxin-1-like isoform X1 [Corticium candelabrum]XP_062501077.1 ataxin-1-like isoform X1 [Corticium candelabrum]
MSQDSSSSSDTDALSDPKIARLRAFDELLPSPAPAQPEEIEWSPPTELFRPNSSVSMPTGQIVSVQTMTIDNLTEYAQSTDRTLTEYCVEHIEIAEDDQARITLRRLGTGNSALLVTKNYVPLFSKGQGWVSVCPEETYRLLLFTCQLIAESDIILISDY